MTKHRPPEEETYTHTGLGVPRAPTTGPVRGRILVLAGPQVGRKYLLDGGIVIGRASDAAIRLDDSQVSRMHARIRPDGDGGYVIEDLGSRNGTMVNGEPITKHTLAFGDRVQIGSHTVLLFSHQDPLEDQVLQRQKMEAIGRLGAGIAHDFNNLLGAVVASMDFIGGLPDDTALRADEVQECLNDVRTAARRAAELTRRLLGFARRGPQRHGPVDVSGLCDEVVHLIRRAFDKSVEISSEVTPGLVVTGDRAQLYQLLMNLCINARDAMPQGGRIRIRAKLLTQAEVLAVAPLSNTSPHAVLTVTDTGMGMNAETRRRVFEPFFTTKSVAGSGLGLATVYEVTTSHGGHIDLESEEGAGTTFSVYLPAPAQEGRKVSVPTIERKRRDTQGPGPGVTGIVLVVDDKEVVRRSAGRLLRQVGHKVLFASDGQEAYDIYVAAETKPDLVLLDLDMPNVNGEQSFRMLKAHDPTVRVLFVSGYWDDVREHKLREMGGLGFLPKPYDASRLRVLVNQILGGPIKDPKRTLAD